MTYVGRYFQQNHNSQEKLARDPGLVGLSSQLVFTAYVLYKASFFAFMLIGEQMASKESPIRV